MALLESIKGITYLAVGGGYPGQLSTTKAITYLVIGAELPPPQRIRVRLVSLPQEP